MYSIKETDKPAKIINFAANMKGLIAILPDVVANQIAAGEVVQRPASAVKELLENAVDAKATLIKLWVKEGGKTLIQIQDNGTGMNETDARMCFERHATSKIRESEDLFRLHTKGFRGEALATIAAIAKVNLKTKTSDQELGTEIQIEAGEVISQEVCNTPTGTVFTIKNLFYNVPARRKFLKSDGNEFHHILEEFTRVSLAHPDIEFQLFNNNVNVLTLKAGNFKKRIVDLMGSSYEKKLITIEENTELASIQGFIVKPEFAKKKRGEQFFLLNQRFIKSPYLHNAIVNAFSDLIPKDVHPGYFINLEVPADKIDINIHPTKTEVKFEDERYIYAILQAAARKAIGSSHITPSLDFNRETAFDVPMKTDIRQVTPPSIHVNPGYNPFKENSFSGKSSQTSYNQMDFLLPEEDISALLPSDDFSDVESLATEKPSKLIEENNESFNYFQLNNQFIAVNVNNQLLIVHQNRAHARVLFEKMQHSMEHNSSATQMELFPESMELSPLDYALFEEIAADLMQIGFDIDPFGTNTIVVRGIPTDAEGIRAAEIIEHLLEEYKNFEVQQKTTQKEKIARILANKLAVKSGILLNRMEVNNLISDLLQCKMPHISPSGKPVFLNFTIEELQNKFQL